MVVGYIIYSLGILGSIIYCGSMFNIFVANFYCKGSVNLAMVIIAGLSGLAFLCEITCWVLWQVVRSKVHGLMKNF